MSAATDPTCHGAAAPAPRSGARKVVLLGNPNAGKSTLFNALTGAQAQISNWTGTTVERMEAALHLPGHDGAIAVVDVPGTYSLAARSPDERIAIDAVLGRDGPPPDVVLALVDAPRLQRSLYLVLQLLELNVPVVVALNLMDEARAEGVEPDAARLQASLGVPVLPIVARSGEGLDALRGALVQALREPVAPGGPHGWTEVLRADADEVVAAFPPGLAALARGDVERARALARWLLLSVDASATLRGEPDVPRAAIEAVQARARAAGRDLEGEIVGQRYAWIDAHAPGWIRRDARADQPRLSDRIDRVLLHPASGALVFGVVMALVFQALFAWSDPAIGFIEGVFAWVGGGVGGVMDALVSVAPGWLGDPLVISRDLIVDGIIGGVGAILVFLPQIGLLFLFIALLEDVGYLARAAHLMDRLLRAAGLPGRAFVPLLSGFACAVPAILSTRSMPRFRDRLLTMMVIPLTSCSARLPVYTLMIAALFPASVPWWPVDVRPSALFGMYLLSTVVTLIGAAVLGRLMLPQEATPEFLELPPYRVPHLPTVGRTVIARMGDFVREAGQVILVATVVLWALLYFPRYGPEDVLSADEIAAVADPAEQEALAAPRALERSFAGRLGKTIEPALTPLGYDWRIGIGLIGAFAAREVFVSTLGVVYGVGEVDEEDEGLRDRIREARRPDGTRVYTPLTGLSIMVFFAFAFQCLSTLAVLRRETGGWRWPAFIVGYMSVLAWVAAFAVYQGGRWLGFS